jgi:2-(1,2-epoxy-1,2-dihydrophenyl)acetyl-CoA isomerase
MTGERVRAERAEAIGILQRVYPVETFDAEALAYTSRLADGPTLALAAMKEGLNAAEHGLDAVLALEHRAQPALFAGDDCLAGLRAFLDKTPSTFRGVR